MAVCHWSELTSPDMNSTSAMGWCQRGLQHCRFRQPFGYGPSSQQSWWRWDRWICGAMISCDMLKLSFLFFLWPLFKGQLNTFHMGMDQYLLIPCLGGWTSINPSYFDVNYRGTRFWHTAISTPKRSNKHLATWLDHWCRSRAHPSPLHGLHGSVNRRPRPMWEAALRPGEGLVFLETNMNIGGQNDVINSNDNWI